MIKAHGYAVKNASDKLSSFQFERRELKEDDVLIEILFCGVCHSDIHQVRNEWGGANYPMVPGHEIVGKVQSVGSKVSKFKVGDIAGVGCMVDSCQHCESCHENLEQFCEQGTSFTYNSFEQDKKTPTYGGYSDRIVVKEKFALKISAKLDLARVAPLLCAGITTYSPMRQWQVRAGQKIGVVGLGGLGHMAIKFGHSFGAHVTLFTTSVSKCDDALKLGADAVVLSKNSADMALHTNTFDFILDTVANSHDINPYLQLLKRDGVMVQVGVPNEAVPLNLGNLIVPRRKLVGSLIGGIAETQEMLDYCAEHNILSDIEQIPIQKINDAYERMLKSDVKYRFVIDMKSLETK